MRKRRRKRMSKRMMTRMMRMMMMIKQRIHACYGPSVTAAYGGDGRCRGGRWRRRLEGLAADMVESVFPCLIAGRSPHR